MPFMLERSDLQVRTYLAGKTTVPLPDMQQAIYLREQKAYYKPQTFMSRLRQAYAHIPEGKRFLAVPMLRISGLQDVYKNQGR
jgi:hypothetical protein